MKAMRVIMSPWLVSIDYKISAWMDKYSLLFLITFLVLISVGFGLLFYLFLDAGKLL
jgi:hypothetical protein